MSEVDMEKLVSLCKRRGYIYPSSEIYGGLNSCYDYGPLGAELKRKLKEFWWKSMTQKHDNIEGLDSSILMHPRIWEASGHVQNFTDPLVDCKSCKARFREDKLEAGTKVCPNCKKGELTPARQFNLMFSTEVGSVAEEASTIYLRPETAQGIFVNFLNVLNTSRQRIPFGIAQVGKAFRNEIVARQFIFRTREFEQMEMQFFVRPGTEMEWYNKWKEKRWQWHRSLGFAEANLKFYDHLKLAHYANAACDIQFNFPMGFRELEGIHSRTDYDLGRHSEFSGKKMQYFDSELNESYVPYVVETSIGCDRMFLAMLCNAYDEEQVNDGMRSVLRLPAALAPVKVAVLPLMKKDGLPEKALEIFNDLRYRHQCYYEEKDSIGKRYRRMDAIGTPYCITIDHQTLTDNTVTIRERDSMEQVRIHIEDVAKVVSEKVDMNNVLRTLV